MASLKIDMRNDIINTKDKYKETRDKRHLVEAAVGKGVYYGIGGEKVIPLPPYCDSIVNAVRIVTRAKIRFKGNIIQDIERLSNEVIKGMETLVTVDLDVANRIPYIVICDVLNNDTARVRVDGEGVSNRNLAKVAVILMQIESRLFKGRELELIFNITWDKLNKLDKRL